MMDALHQEFGDPTHPDAQELWSVLMTLVSQLTAARFDVQDYYPKQGRLLQRMAEALRAQMIDAELGLLDATPEQRVAHALQKRAE